MAKDLIKIFLRKGCTKKIAEDLHLSYSQVNRCLNGYRTYSDKSKDDMVRQYAIDHYDGFVDPHYSGQHDFSHA